MYAGEIFQLVHKIGDTMNGYKKDGSIAMDRVLDVSKKKKKENKSSDLCCAACATENKSL